MAPAPLALLPALPSELLTYILAYQDQTYPTTIIICKSRASFLSSLLNAIPASHPFPSRESSIPTGDEDLYSPSETQPRHPLLIPTLHQIATSRHINLVFIPTLSHLRAYLVTFPHQAVRLPPENISKTGGRGIPLLVVYGLVELHHDTSEWSAQGLGNSLAALVEVGSRSSVKIVLIEEREIEEEDVQVDEVEEGDKWRKLSKVWEQKVPILNGSVRRAGLDVDDAGWSGRTIEVGRILGRWFKFGRGDWVI
ncbi:Uncharacterized protein BP5553_10078 [Venustampulla echinocandica]|uniref:Uncharacterized protein n=1 Tax=Venustampulla echinocandica TaxID=2656787 RepID=A0A370TA96_9HELO|nr:Uncharacterized protein BP5553_10078 [Venustampulla echinocandica]RDL30733.1 Uncharacterized protein BP5553_10078 [Venustampulla echinocandica]